MIFNANTEFYSALKQYLLSDDELREDNFPVAVVGCPGVVTFEGSRPIQSSAFARAGPGGRFEGKCLLTVIRCQ